MTIRLIVIVLILLNISCSKDKAKNKIHFEYDGHIYVEMCISDTIRGKFIFDTGASDLYLDSIFVANTSMQYLNTEDARIGGAGNVGYRTIPLITDTIPFSLGNNLFYSTKTPIIELSGFNDDDIAGIIGINFFKKNILNINFSDKYLCILDSTTSETIDLDAIDFSLVKNRIYIDTKIIIDSTRTIFGPFEIDLGCADEVLLTNNTAKENALNEVNKKVSYFISEGGVGGASSSGYDLRANDISIGNYTFKDIVIGYSNDTLGALSKRDYLGLLGAPLFSRFDLFIDFPNQKVFLNALPDSQKKSKSTITGFNGLRRSNGNEVFMVVNSIYKPSQVQVAGLQIGDTIVGINGKRIKDYTKEEISELLKTEGIILTLQVKDGIREKTIEFKTKEII